MRVYSTSLKTPSRFLRICLIYCGIWGEKVLQRVEDYVRRCNWEISLFNDQMMT